MHAWNTKELVINGQALDDRIELFKHGRLRVLVRSGFTVLQAGRELRFNGGQDCGCLALSTEGDDCVVTC